MSRFSHYLKREAKRVWRDRGGLIPYAAYPALLLLLFVFAIDVRSLDLPLARALVLLMIALSTLSLAPRFWGDEMQSGILVQLHLLPPGLIGAAYAKYLVQLIAVALPLALLILALGHVMLGASFGTLLLPVLLALPSLIGLGMLSAALSLGRESGLLALVLLPFYAPVVILLALAGIDGGMGTASLYWLGALAVLSLSLTPLATAAALKQQLAG